MKCTKKEFVTEVSENLTVFLGRSKRVIEQSELNEKNIFNCLREKNNKRACKRHSNSLEFCKPGGNSSWLYLDNSKYGKYILSDGTVVYYMEEYSKDKNGNLSDEPWVVCWYAIA